MLSKAFIILSVVAACGAVFGSDDLIRMKLGNENVDPNQVDEYFAQVENKDNLMIGEFSVQELMKVGQFSLDDCESKRFNDLMSTCSEYRLDYNKAVQTWCLRKMSALSNLCAQSIDSLLAKQVSKLDQDDVQEVRNLISFVPLGANGENSGEALKVALDKYVESLPGKSDEVKDARLARINSACSDIMQKLRFVVLFESNAKFFGTKVNLSSEREDYRHLFRVCKMFNLSIAPTDITTKQVRTFGSGF